MVNQANIENWQVDVGGQVYDATFADLGEWICDGALHPEDKVRKGNLRWIEAGKIPGLIPFFNAKANGMPMPAVVTATDAAEQVDVEPAVGSVAISSSVGTPADVQVAANHPSNRQSPPNPDFCAMHGGIPSAFLCTSCGTGFCKTCPNSYGGTVKICPMCGSMCKASREVHEERKRRFQMTNAINEGFGMRDFFNAITHPLKFKTSLIVGAIMFAFFSVSQSATGIGGMVMFASAILCFMLANMMLFGVLANTVENFAQGNLEANFMPTFDDFSVWDDIVQPFFLYIAVMISSFGPFILTLIIGTYLVLSSVSSQMNAFQSEVERLPGTHYYQGRDTVEQSQEIKRVLNDTADKHEETIGKYNQAATGNSNISFAQPTPDNAEEFWQQAQENRKKELEAAFGKTQETKDGEFSAFTSNLLKLAAPLVVIGAIAFLWGCFFFPAASAVAGYTRSFSATMNPLVGLDTIRRLGVDYAKILLMGLVLVVASGVVAFILGFVLAPLNLPGMGNIVAKGFSSLFTFYLSAVFSCLLGYALFKNSDKLQLSR